MSRHWTTPRPGEVHHNCRTSSVSQRDWSAGSVDERRPLFSPLFDVITGVALWISQETQAAKSRKPWIWRIQPTSLRVFRLVECSNVDAADGDQLTAVAAGTCTTIVSSRELQSPQPQTNSSTGHILACHPFHLTRELRLLQVTDLRLTEWCVSRQHVPGRGGCVRPVARSVVRGKRNCSSHYCV